MPSRTTDPFLPRLLRFSVVGIVNTGVDLAVFLFLFRRLGIPLAPANIAAFAAALANSYLLNRTWTFAARPRPGGPARAAAFALICTGGAALATTALWLMTEGGIPVVPAKLASVAVSLAWNFTLVQRFVFTAQPPVTRSGTPPACP